MNHIVNLRWFVVLVLSGLILGRVQDVSHGQSFTPVYSGTTSRNIYWSNDSTNVSFQLGYDVNFNSTEAGITTTNNSWYNFNVLTNTLTNSNTWSLQAPLSTSEINLIDPAGFPTSPSFVYASPSGRYVAYARILNNQHILSLFDRTTNQIWSTYQILFSNSHVDDFNVIWSASETSFIFRAATDGGGMVFIYASGYSPSLLNGTMQIVNFVDIGTQSYSISNVYDISADGQQVLMRVIEVGNPPHPLGASPIRLMVWQSNNPSLSKVITSVDANTIRGASFASDERKILYISNTGLWQYDTMYDFPFVLDTTINSIWVSNAVFSPNSRWIAIDQSPDYIAASGSHFYVLPTPPIHDMINRALNLHPQLQRAPSHMNNR
jgi:hypothetical protein